MTPKFMADLATRLAPMDRWADEVTVLWDGEWFKLIVIVDGKRYYISYGGMPTTKLIDGFMFDLSVISGRKCNCGNYIPNVGYISPATRSTAVGMCSNCYCIDSTGELTCDQIIERLG